MLYFTAVTVMAKGINNFIGIILTNMDPTNIVTPTHWNSIIIYFRMMI
jgi:hypothetical protein